MDLYFSDLSGLYIGVKIMNERKLIEKAKEAMEHSYSPYSKFKVGAAIFCESNKVYTGCNIENSSYGATNCAERTAIFKAISEGERNFLKIAVVSSANEEIFPCGICRQVLFEFMENGTFITENSNGEILTYNIKELLPNSFKF